MAMPTEVDRLEFELFPGRCLFVALYRNVSNDAAARLVNKFLPRQAGKRKLDDSVTTSPAESEEPPLQVRLERLSNYVRLNITNEVK